MSIESASLEQHKDKLGYLLKVASVVLIMTAAVWAIFFVAIKDPLGVLTETVLVVLGCMAYAQTKRNNTKIIAFIYLPILCAIY